MMPTIVFVGGLIDGETLDLPDLPDTYRVAVPMSRPRMLGSTEPARPLFAEAVYRRVIGKKGGMIVNRAGQVCYQVEKGQ